MRHSKKNHDDSGWLHLTSTHASENIVRHIAIAVLYPTPQNKACIWSLRARTAVVLKWPRSSRLLYAVDDEEEIDFETVLREDPVPIP